MDKIAATVFIVYVVIVALMLFRTLIEVLNIRYETKLKCARQKARENWRLQKSNRCVYTDKYLWTGEEK